MITEEYLKDNFLTAYFIDQERKNIEIQTTTEDKKKVFTTIIPFEEGHHQYEALKSVMSLDQLHESTYQKHKKENNSMTTSFFLQEPLKHHERSSRLLCSIQGHKSVSLT